MKHTGYELSIYVGCVTGRGIRHRGSLTKNYLAASAVNVATTVEHRHLDPLCGRNTKPRMYLGQEWCVATQNHNIELQPRTFRAGSQPSPRKIRTRTDRPALCRPETCLHRSTVAPPALMQRICKRMSERYPICMPSHTITAAEDRT